MPVSVCNNILHKRYSMCIICKVSQIFYCSWEVCTVYSISLAAMVHEAPMQNSFFHGGGCGPLDFYFAKRIAYLGRHKLLSLFVISL